MWSFTARNPGTRKVFCLNSLVLYLHLYEWQIYLMLRSLVIPDQDSLWCYWTVLGALWRLYSSVWKTISWISLDNSTSKSATHLSHVNVHYVFWVFYTRQTSFSKSLGLLGFFFLRRHIISCVSQRRSYVNLYFKLCNLPSNTWLLEDCIL